jgi:hypothetical protein
MGFLICLCVLALIALVLAEFKVFWLPLPLMIAFLLIWDHKYNEPDIGTWAYTNWRLLLAAGLAYLPIGAAFTIPRWMSYCRRKKRKDTEFAKSHFYVQKNYVWENRPLAINNKSLLASWVMYWPVCFVWWILFVLTEDILTTAVKNVYNMIHAWLGDVYDRITAHTYDGTEHKDKE